MMIGKKVKFDDYRFTFGKETPYIYIYAAMKDEKSGNKVIIYSYSNNVKKVYFGSFFVRDNKGIVMTDNSFDSDRVKSIIDSIVKSSDIEGYEVISLKDIDSIQVIDENVLSFDIDTDTLYNKTIPKEVVKNKNSVKSKKSFSYAYFFFFIFIIVVALFFFVNPEVLRGKSRYFICNKNSTSSDIPANIKESINLSFNAKNSITGIDITTDYVFSDSDYFNGFRDNGYFYQYMKEGDTYKFIDDEYTYRVFSKINVNDDYFMPRDMDKLLDYYNNNGYSCKESFIE